MNLSEPDGYHDCVSISIMLCKIYCIIFIIGLITSPSHVFVPHPRHENVAMDDVDAALSAKADGIAPLQLGPSSPPRYARVPALVSLSREDD